MESILYNPLFGIILSLAAFEIGKSIYKKWKFPILNPLLISIIVIIFILLKLDISYNAYSKGGDIILFFIGPATVALAVPLYKNMEKLKKNFSPIIIGIVAGSATAMSSVIIIGKILGLDQTILISIIPKSITTPIGLELSKSIGGDPSITFVGILITGITGAISAPLVCKLFKVEDKVAKGIGIGTASHAVGTTKAIEMGEVEGAMSGLAIGLAGLATIFLIPLIIKLFVYLNILKI